MNEEALNQLIDNAMEKEKALAVREQELALENKQFAQYLKEKKHQDEQLSVLWDMVKEYMEENNISKHETPFISLSLSPSGKYRCAEGTELEQVPDELCDIKRTLNNKKVKAFVELNGKLPDGIESTGNILRKKIKE